MSGGYRYEEMRKRTRREEALIVTDLGHHIEELEPKSGGQKSL